MVWLTASAGAVSDDRIAERLRQTPRCPVARYVAGCRSFDADRPATAVRHLMIAQHAEPQLESAGLLVFSGLAWISDRSRTLLDTVVRTWIEYRRMPFDRTPRERRLLDALRIPLTGDEAASTTVPAAQIEELERFLRLPIRRLHADLLPSAASKNPVESDTISALRGGPSAAGAPPGGDMLLTEAE